MPNTMRPFAPVALRLCLDRIAPARKHRLVQVDLPALNCAADAAPDAVSGRRRSSGGLGAMDGEAGLEADVPADRRNKQRRNGELPK